MNISPTFQAETKKIAVIGAGLAGLTAAYRLHQAGRHVDLFEAKKRVGGRVLSVRMKNNDGIDCDVELGGQNITDGGEAKHLSSLIKELDLSVQQKSMSIDQLVYENERFEGINVLIQQHQGSIPLLRKAAQKAKNIGQLIDLYCGSHAMLRNALIARMTAYEGIDAYQQSIYHNIDTLECSLSGGIAKAHEAYNHEPSHITISCIKGGNSRIASEMANILERRIHYQKFLKRLFIRDSSIELKFDDGSTFNYDQAILAIPASTLKNIDLSNTYIDKERLNKIQSIQYGKNYKIALPLPLNRTNPIKSVVHDNVISFLNYDETIQLLYVNDSLNDFHEFIHVLSKAYHCDFVTPSNTLHPFDYDNERVYNENVYFNWAQDPCFLGSYSGYSTQISEELDHKTVVDRTCYKSLFVPIDNRLFFAGEHTTILDCIGTMEAAVESGERIARAIHKGS